MKPLKNIEPLAKWVLRISVLLVLGSTYYKQIQSFNYENIEYIINMLFLLTAALLVLGGMQKKPTLTLISAIFLTLISIYKIYGTYHGNFLQTSMYEYLMLSGVGLFFLSKGN